LTGVFVSVGSMMPFDRLVQAMDEWAAAHPQVPVEIQIGRGRYEPRHAAFVRLLPVADYRRRVAAARLFVAHAGMGSIIAAIEAGKPLLMLPRLQAQGEHNTDHQLATAASIGSRPGLHVAADAADLMARASALLTDAGAPPAPIARFADPGFTTRIRAFIEAP
jgi:UDP-N-acetylglucosamine transferase subunit ALG13